MQIVILKLRQKTTVTATDHDQRHWKAAKVKFNFPPDKQDSLQIKSRKKLHCFLDYSLSLQALIFVMPLLGVGYVMTLVVRPTVRSFGIPLMVAVSDAMEAVIVSTQVILQIMSVTRMIMSFQGFVISLPYCFLNSEVQGVVKSHWSRWRMVRTSQFVFLFLNEA